MGRVMYDMARESHGYGDIFEIKGFIDDNINALDNRVINFIESRD